jgi:hypothetical protein
VPKGLVGMAGLEPATSGSQSPRPAKLGHIPLSFILGSYTGNPIRNPNFGVTRISLYADKGNAYTNLVSQLRRAPRGPRPLQELLRSAAPDPPLYHLRIARAEGDLHEPGLRPSGLGLPVTRSKLRLAATHEATQGRVVPKVGLEPTTRGFSVRCSTN